MYKMNAVEYNEKVMKGHFKKIYPVIASQIIDRTGITSGKCIDLGGGPGMLGICIAKITDMKVTVYDLMKECVELVPGNCLANGVADKVNAVQGVAEDMKFDDNSVDLVVSRGSIFFWEDQKKGLSEISRVLRPGGWAYIGGGFGTKELMDEILKIKEKEDPEWFKGKNDRMKKNSPEHFQKIVDELGLGTTVERNDAGTWIVFQKK